MNWERRETPPLVPTRCGLQFITAPFKNTSAGQPTNTTGRHPRRKLGGTESTAPSHHQEEPQQSNNAQQATPAGSAARPAIDQPATGHRQPPRQAPNHPPPQKARIQNTPRNARAEAHRDPSRKRRQDPERRQAAHTVATKPAPVSYQTGAQGGQMVRGARPVPFDHTLGDLAGISLIWDIRPISVAPSDWGTQACV